MTRAQAAGFFILAGMMSWTPGASAQSDPYQITSAEKAACTADAIRLCAGSYPDEGQLLACMASNRASLSSGCLVVFDAGLRRRHIAQR